MGTILDILGSTIIGGLITLMALSFMNTTAKYFASHGDDLIVQQNLTGVTRTLEYDLKKMGYGIQESKQIVLVADSTHLKYLGDIDRNGNPDTLEYYVGSSSELIQTQNPDDRFLYRKINGLPASGAKSGVVTEFRFDYLDQDGILLDTSNPLNLKAVKMVRITLQVENTAAYSSNPVPEKSEYRTAFWQQTRLVSRNLRR